MRLALKNIREHARREFALPDKGLVQVRGESGVGKTSLLEAVAFALYDNRRGVRTFNRSTCLVELSGLGLDVARGKGPAVLRANGLEGEPAQGEIERLLGMSEAEFMASSYIVQDLYGSLLSLPAADQLRLIEGLASGREDPGEIKTRIRERIRRAERVAQHAEGQVASLAAHKAEREAALAALPPPPDPAVGLRLAKAVAEREADVTRGRAEGDALRQKFVGVAAALADPRYGLRAQLDAQTSELRALEERAERERQAGAAELATLGAAWPRASRAETKATLRALTDRIARAEANARQAAALQALREKHFIADDKPPGAVAVELDEGVKGLEESLAGRERVVQAAELARHVRDCPVCATPLVVADGALKVAPEHAAGAHGTLAALTAELASERRRLRELVNDAATARTLAAALGSDAAPDLTALRAELADWRAYEDVQLARDVAVARLAEKAARNEHDLAARRAAVRALEERSPTEELPPRAPLEAEQQRLLAELGRWEKAARDQERELAAARAAWREHEDQVRGRERRQLLESEVRALGRKLAAKTTELTAARRELAAAERLRELSDQAASDAALAILTTINVNAQKYLETLFPDTGTSVFLLNEKTLQSGEKRPKLALEILHKGSRYESLASLSGGERSRVALAFQLALSDMYRSPILMVDEGMKGLSLELKLLCLDALREAARDKLVLVVEHGAPESAFDVVIDVGTHA